MWGEVREGFRRSATRSSRRCKQEADLEDRTVGSYARTTVLPMKAAVKVIRSAVRAAELGRRIEAALVTPVAFAR